MINIMLLIVVCDSNLKQYNFTLIIINFIIFFSLHKVQWRSYIQTSFKSYLRHFQACELVYDAVILGLWPLLCSYKSPNSYSIFIHTVEATSQIHTASICILMYPCFLMLGIKYHYSSQYLSFCNVYLSCNTETIRSSLLIEQKLWTFSGSRFSYVRICCFPLL